MVAHRLDSLSHQVIEGETVESTRGLASSSVAAPSLFLGWVACGLLVAWYLARRGHDGATMGALGAGLGPLMVAVAIDTVRQREERARPLVLAEGSQGAGGLDLLVLVQGRGEQVVEVLPSLESVQDDLRSLTLARVVSFEWVEGDLDNDVVIDAEAELRCAAELIPNAEPALALLPGTRSSALERFVRERDRTLVLVAVGDEHGGFDLSIDR